MARRFSDRRAAGRALAARLESFRNLPSRRVLALPRGGVPVAWEVARALEAPLDVFLVRKLGVPGAPETAMGAVATGNLCVRNERLLGDLGITESEFEAVRRRELVELHRREQSYRPGRPPVDVTGCHVFVVDDGLATGATMRAALQALRSQAPRGLIAAVPVGSAEAVRELKAFADVVICLRTPEPFLAVSLAYDRFLPTEDDEVRALLATPELSSPPDGAVERRTQEERDGS